MNLRDIQPKWGIVLLVPALVIFTSRSLLRLLNQSDELGILTSLSGVVAIFGLLLIAYQSKSRLAWGALVLSIAGHALIVWNAVVGAPMIYFAIGLSASHIVHNAKIPAGLAAAGALIRGFDQDKGDAVVIFGIVWLLVMLYTQLSEPTVDDVVNRLQAAPAAAGDAEE